MEEQAQRPKLRTASASSTQPLPIPPLELLDAQSEPSVLPVASAFPPASSTWTREQLIRLLCAWRDAKAEQDDADDGIQSTELLTDRIYARFTSLPTDDAEQAGDAGRDAGDGEVSTTESEMLEMQNALVRSYAFIAHFNGSCKSVSIRVGGSVVAQRKMNWFAISEREQIRLVGERFSGPCSFLFSVDERMFKMIGAILGVVSANEGQMDLCLVDHPLELLSVEPDASATPPIRVASLKEVELHPELEAIEENLPAYMWRRYEIFRLIRAWGGALDGMESIPKEPTSEFKNLLYELFCSEHGDDETPRKLLPTWMKVVSLVRSFQFVKAFNEGKINWRTRSVRAIKKSATWYELPESYQSWIVKKHFKKNVKGPIISFFYLYNDMLLPIELNVRRCPHWWPPQKYKAVPARQDEEDEDEEEVSVGEEEEKKEEPGVGKKTRRRRKSNQPSSHYKKRGRKPNWTEDEMEKLLRAWSEVVKEPLVSKHVLEHFNAHVHDKFLVLCGGKSRRDQTEVGIKIASLVQSCAFVLDYKANKFSAVANRRWSDPAENTKEKKLWFSLSSPQQREIVKTFFKDSHSVIFSYASRAVMARVVDLTPHTPDRSHGKASMNRVAASMKGWTRKELALLLRAWLEVVTHCTPREQSETLLSQIYTQFQALCGGESTKRVSAIAFQKTALQTSFRDVAAYFRKSEPSEDAKRDEWFLKSEVERKQTLETAAGTRHFYVDLDKEMFEILARIDELERDLASQASSAKADEANAIILDGDESFPRDGHSSESGDSEFEIVPVLSASSIPHSASPLVSGVASKSEASGSRRPARKRASEQLPNGRKRQRVDSSGSLSEQQQQIRLLKTLLDQVRDERQVEREERQREREEMQLELARWRQERLAEQESYKALVRELRGSSPIGGSKENETSWQNI